MGNWLGAKHTLGFKPQSVAGTPETTVSTFLVTQSFGMDAKPEHIPRKSFIGTGRQLPPRKGWIKPEGKATCDVMASTPHPFYWAFGGVATTTPSGGTTARLHTITDAGAPIRLTAEGDKVFGKAKQGDVYINKITLAGKVGEEGTVAIEWYGLSHNEGATLTSTPTFVTDVLTCRAVTVTIDGSTRLDVTDYEISWDGQLEQLPVLENATGAPKVIRRKAAPEVTGKLSFIDYPAAELTKFINATTFALVVELDGDIIEAALPKFLRVTLPACAYSGGLDGDISAEVITGEAEFKAYHDTVTSTQIKVEAQNSLTSISA